MIPVADEAEIPPHRRRDDVVRRAGPVAAGILLPFLLVFYLGLEEGGYGQILRSQVGVAIWWIVMLGSLIGILPTARIGWAGYIFLGLFVAFAVWTGLGMIWSESAERTVIELARVAMLLGVFSLALSTQSPGYLRRVVGAVGAAIVAIAILALASRFHPSWFPPNAAAEDLPTEAARLSYPLTYWNGLASLIAIGIPLLLWTAVNARHLLARTLSVAVVPLLVLTSYFTISRGGIAETIVAVVVLFTLYPRRLSLLAPLLIGGGGATFLILAAAGRTELADNTLTDVALQQGDQMIVLTLVVCVVAGLLAAAVQVALKRELLSIPEVSRRTALRASVGTTLAVLVAAAAVGVPGKLSSSWDEFRQPVNPGSGAERLTSVSGSGRYQWWESAVDAGSAEPLTGIGPGTWGFWWARGDGEIQGVVRDAHSLYLEVFGEQGVIGLLMILGLVGGIIAVGVSRCIRERADPDRAGLFAAATAATATFAAAATVDWAWEMTVLPAVYFLLGAGIVGPGATLDAEVDDQARAKPGVRPRLVLAGLATASIVAIGVPMLSATAVRDSQSLVSQGKLVEALESAQKAHDLLPLAASPLLQEALVRELGGDLPGAAVAARQATLKETTNWRNWLVLSRVEAELGNDQASAQAYAKARSLNPRSLIFSE